MKEHILWCKEFSKPTLLITLPGCYHLQYTLVAFSEITMDEFVYITHLLLLTELAGKLFEIVYWGHVKKISVLA